VSNAIIDKNARIGKDVRLSPEGCEDGWVDESKGLFVRDGVLVVLKDAVVPDGTVAGSE
jgi:glucose-1-phosphate adenylyltransferase